MTTGSRRAGGRGPAAVLAPLVGLALAASALGCAPTSEGLMTVSTPEVRVSNELIAGPAAERASTDATGGINRLGSAEVPVRVYEPGGDEPWATLVWAHGGSFLRGTLDWPEADWVSRHLAEAGLRVYSVDYALASDAVKAPAPSNDVTAVLREVSTRYDGPTIVGGASAGGHLAVLAALAETERAMAPDALALIYPTLHRTQRAAAAISALTEALPDQRRFGVERITEMYEFYLGDIGEIGDTGGSVRVEPIGPTGEPAGGDPDPRAYPNLPEVVGELSAQRIAVLPPTIIVNADADDLRASGEQFAEQLREAGVDVLEAVQPGTVHGYMNRPEENDTARADAQATIDLVVQGLREVLDIGAPLEPETAGPTTFALPEARLNRDATD